MAKSKKSKILAMALCASVMTGIYASPVMATELYEDGDQWVTTKVGSATKITELEGLEKITLGDSVKITTDGKGIIRVGNAGGVNTRVHDDGFYVNTSGDDRNKLTETSLKAGILTLAGKELTFAQLANINSVIGENGVINAADGSIVGGVKMRAGKVSGTGFFVKSSDNALDTTGLKLGNEYLNETKLGTINYVITDDGAVESKGDVTSKAEDGKTYSLNNVGKNTSGITIDSEGKVTTIEGAFSVDKKGYIYNANRSFQVTKDGAARFGNKYDDHIRMEKGVLSVKTDQNTTVARVSEDGFYVYKDNGKFVIGEDSATYLAKGKLNLGAEDGQTLTADKLSTINSVITDNGKVVSQGDVTSTYTKEDGSEGHYYLNKVGEDLDALETNVGNISGYVAGIKRNDGNLPYGEGITEIEDVVGVNGKNGRFYVLGEDGRTQAAVITNDGTARFGDYNNANVRMENGVLSINSEGTNAVARLSKDGLMLSDSVNGQQTLTAAKIADIQHIEHVDNATVIEQNTAISADGIVVKDPVSGVSTKTKYNGFYVKDEYGNNVSSLKDDGLMLTDQESGETHTLNATDIADIKGIDRSGNDTDGHTTTIEVATSFTKDGMTTTTVTTDEIGVGGSGFYANSTGITVGDGRFNVDSETGNLAISNGTVPVFQVNGETGQVNIGANGGSQTVITGNSITTETLNVEKIVLGDKIVDKETGDAFDGKLEIGADGSIRIADKFEVDTDNLAAHYGEYELTLDGNGFALGNSEASLTLTDSGYAFSGSVNLGAGSDVGFTYAKGTVNEKNYTLDSLVDKVNDIYDRTDGIYKDAEGNTVVTDGTWNAESKEMEGANSSITVGRDGATFESTTKGGTTNINGGAIKADSSSIGNDVSGGSGSGSIGMTGDGTYTDGSEHSGNFVNGGNSYKFTNNANGFTGTVTEGEHTTTIENGAKGSNTTVTGEGNTSASSGVGIGNDGAFISDSVTNGNISHTVNGGSITDTVTNDYMTVTEVKDENGSATTVNDANDANVKSTVSQDTKGQTVSTGTGTSVNTGNDFCVKDNETGKSIYMSDIGHVEDIDSEIQNSDGSKTTVVDAVNNEAEIRRNEIERVDGRINNLENRVGKLEDRVDKVGAMAAAIANLRTMGYDPAAPTEVAVGIGQYRDETGAALGLFHYPNRDFMLSLSVSTSGDEVMGGIGATWKFGRKSPEKVAEIKKAQAEADARRAEEAKLAKAEEMKQAAKEAKIKAQQERHAKLAAQAEAAK